MRMRRGRRGAAGLAACVLLLTGCAGQPAALPVIGSPQPTPSATSAASDRGALLAAQWNLTGAPLPDDWPDVPLPSGTEVTSAYAIGTDPQRTWSATFAADEGTALDLATPVVEALRGLDYVPIAEYVGAPSTNTGLFSFAAPTFAVYVVLGEDEGRPNLVITIRGSIDDAAGLPDEPSASASPTAAPTEAPTGGLWGTPTPTRTR